MKNLMLAAGLMLSLAHSAFAWDQKDNHYKLRLDADMKRAHVQADVWIEGKELAMFNVSTLPGLKNGQAEFIEKLEVRDASGKLVEWVDKGEGDYELKGDRRLKLQYDVRLDHDKYNWPGGLEEVAYRTDEGLMAVAYYLFLVPGEKMLGQTRIEFDLPAGWQARTPWRGTDQPNVFLAASRREMVNNAIFLGTAQAERFTAGGIELQMVLGKRYWPQRQMMKSLIESQMQAYLAMFGKPPLAERYLIIANQGDSGDGGAFSGSFSQFLRSDINTHTRPFWGRVMAHELLHFWNGISLVPRERSEEWFKEGVTDYLTIASMAKNGLYDRTYLLHFLENLGRGQTVARQAQGLKSTVQQAVDDKHNSWLLVYGGGSIAALAMDVELRQASGDKFGLPDLMRAMYAEFGQSGKTWVFADLVRVAKENTGVDLAPMLKRIVATTQPTDLAPIFARIGLTYEHHLQMLDHYLLPDANATPAAKQRFQAMFGMPLP